MGVTTAQPAKRQILHATYSTDMVGKGGGSYNSREVCIKIGITLKIPYLLYGNLFMNYKYATNEKFLRWAWHVPRDIWARDQMLLSVLLPEGRGVGSTGK